MKKSKLISIIILSALFIIIVAAIIRIIHGNTAIELNIITVESDRLPEGFDHYKIAHVSDLHNTELGEGNDILLKLLSDAEPDIICITGDLIDSRRTDIDIALDFVSKAVKTAPCYYVNGNHESRIEDYPDLREGLTELGVNLLSNEYKYLENNGDTITILGVDDPAFSSDNTDISIREKLEDLSEHISGYAILLSHRPEFFSAYRDFDIDLVLSGHAHGGQIRLPFIGGILAPNQGLFPKYDSGLYTEDGTNMIVSRGVGNSIFPFRVNNPPEVLLIELKCR